MVERFCLLTLPLFNTTPMGFQFTYNPMGYPNPLVMLVMVLWFPFVLYLFMRLPGQRAVVISFVVAWLFLPEATMILPGIPDYTKMSATCYGIFLATFIFNTHKLQFFRFSWIDIPILLYCLSAYISSTTNALGWYDGVTTALDYMVTWGFPYFLGRLYLGDLKGMRLVALAIFVGGLAYVPLCLFEVRFSPQLHAILYGAHSFGDFGQNIRYDGFRPVVFMRHGLSVGAWMMAATLTGISLWKTGVVKKLRNIPMKVIVGALFITFVAAKSTGAYLLLAAGLGILAGAWYFRTSLSVVVLVTLMSVYLFQNAVTETYVTDQIVHSLSTVMPPERIQSLEFRFDNEELLSDKARERMMFGWGGWGRNRVYDENGKDISVTDSLWIIVFGMNGLFGLMAMFGSFFAPILAFVQKYPARLWKNPQVAPAATMAVVLVLYMADCILNAMTNPVFSVVCGGLAGLAINDRQRRLVGRSLATAPIKMSLPSSDPVPSATSGAETERGIETTLTTELDEELERTDGTGSSAEQPSESPTEPNAEGTDEPVRETAGVGGGRSHRKIRRSPRSGI